MRSLIAAVLSTALLSSFAAAEVRFAKAPTAAEDVAPARVVDRAKVRAALADNRAANLTRFRAYQQKGVFPSNTFGGGKQNVWRDAAGNLCAAATIMNASGMTSLVDQLARDNNFIRLGDVTQGPVLDWILTSGLTQGEIAAIQEPFMEVGEDGKVIRRGGLVARIDPAKRKAEDARLTAKYKQVEADLVKAQQASLDAATDRLMQHPQLAAALIGA